MATNTKIDPTAHTPVEGAKDRTEGHVWLQRMVGEWTTEGEATMPDGSKDTTTGKESVRKLGEYWVVSEATASMPGDDEEGTMIVSLGFDRHKGRFVGSWVGSMMMNLWVYDGELDADGTLHLDTEGEDMADETKTAPYRDSIHWESDDVRTLTSHYKDEKGEWQPFMTVRSTRVK